MSDFGISSQSGASGDTTSTDTTNLTDPFGMGGGQGSGGQGQGGQQNPAQGYYDSSQLQSPYTNPGQGASGAATVQQSQQIAPGQVVGTSPTGKQSGGGNSWLQDLAHSLFGGAGNAASPSAKASMPPANQQSMGWVPTSPSPGGTFPGSPPPAGPSGFPAAQWPSPQPGFSVPWQTGKQPNATDPSQLSAISADQAAQPTADPMTDITNLNPMQDPTQIAAASQPDTSQTAASQAASQPAAGGGTSKGFILQTLLTELQSLLGGKGQQPGQPATASTGNQATTTPPETKPQSAATAYGNLPFQANPDPQQQQQPPVSDAQPVPYTGGPFQAQPDQTQPPQQTATTETPTTEPPGYGGGDTRTTPPPEQTTQTPEQQKKQQKKQQQAGATPAAKAASAAPVPGPGQASPAPSGGPGSMSYGAGDPSGGLMSGSSAAQNLPQSSYAPGNQTGISQLLGPILGPLVAGLQRQLGIPPQQNYATAPQPRSVPTTSETAADQPTQDLPSSGGGGGGGGGGTAPAEAPATSQTASTDPFVPPRSYGGTPVPSTAKEQAGLQSTGPRAYPAMSQSQNLSYIASDGGFSRVNDARTSDISHMNPQFAQRMAAAGKAYEQETGRKPTFGVGYRDDVSQTAAYRRNAALPGGIARHPAALSRALGGRGSLHESGSAMDLPSGPFRDWMAQNGPRFGLRNPIRNDPNHFQMQAPGGRQYAYNAPQPLPAGQNRPPGNLRMAGNTRGDRINNPGNVKGGPYPGQTGRDASGEAIFSSPQAGARAQASLLRAHYNNQTVPQMASRYTATRGDQASWANTVMRTGGFSPNERLNLNDPQTLARLQQGIWRAEGTHPPANLLSYLQGRQSGGPVNAGQPYMVGEAGPEVVVPQQSGTVVPNQKTAGAGDTPGKPLQWEGAPISNDEYSGGFQPESQAQFTGWRTSAPAGSPRTVTYPTSTEGNVTFGYPYPQPPPLDPLADYWKEMSDPAYNARIQQQQWQLRQQGQFTGAAAPDPQTAANMYMGRPVDPRSMPRFRGGQSYQDYYQAGGQTELQKQAAIQAQYARYLADRVRGDMSGDEMGIKGPITPIYGVGGAGI